MARIPEPGGSTRPVVVAVAATLAVCVLGHLAYNRFVLAPASPTAGKGDEPGLDAEGAGAEAGPPRAAGPNCEMGAALLHALAAAKAQEEEGREDCKPKGPPSEEEAERAAAESDARDAEGTSERARRFMKANVQTLEEELRNEKIDAEWAKKTEEAATRAVAATTTGMRLDEVTCRATFCRARVTHVDPSMRGTDMMELLRFPELSAQMLPYAPVEEEETTVIYFARQGHTLSVLSPPGPQPSPPSSGTSAPVPGAPGGPSAPKSGSEAPANLAGG